MGDCASENTLYGYFDLPMNELTIGSSALISYGKVTHDAYISLLIFLLFLNFIKLWWIIFLLTLKFYLIIE